ncbi:MurR/RpiR family transcriptional regulator [Ochrobactrum chromiisoli]|uniref:MurR/RpiR family transcriptional regulator n=1 Tax=Ochrobactrum chromiisoli TaxID=2993941 RepID=A0ABT3QSN7_9HYPH|nr:MurR/RpiR family transcriptional regulator [Ochrobactrum chromiisoli]MCX2698594.1 MurR/RpiR family transcriptional regulator [Ochrobactrum chromiisoli]
MIAENIADGTFRSSVEDWLRALENKNNLSDASHQVLQTIIADPKFASYAAAKDIAERARLNGASVIRTAQALGYAGWPALRQEIRSRYIATLSAVELSSVHENQAASADPVGYSLTCQITELTNLRRSFDRREIRKLADSFASAKRRLIIASGSYAALGKILAHHATLAGYRSELADDAVAISNAIGDLTSDDIVVAVGFWRIYKSTITALKEAKARHSTTALITDVSQPHLRNLADYYLIVPSEGTSFFVSLVPAMAMIECLCLELARIDNKKTSESLESFEKQWKSFDHLFSGEGELG